MSYLKDRIFAFDIETVIDVESSRNFLGLNSEACKSEIAEKNDATRSLLHKVSRNLSSSDNCEASFGELDH